MAAVNKASCRSYLLLRQQQQKERDSSASLLTQLSREEWSGD